MVMKKAAPGFIGNRLQHALYREAVHMVEQGIASPEDIDKTLKYSFVPRYTSIGIFEHFDYAGLDMMSALMTTSSRIFQMPTKPRITSGHALKKVILAENR